MPKKKYFFFSLFAVYVIVAFFFAVILEISQILERQELTTINKRFETRPWLNWSDESLKRLNSNDLLKYHKQYEIPNKWWIWSYTLGWLLENNHPKVMHDIVIFNHSVENQPSTEEIQQHPWLKPLVSYPLSRKTMASIVEFLAKAKVELVVIDNDFSQYTQDDKVLAQAIHQASSGYFGKPVPVLMTSSIKQTIFNRAGYLTAPNFPSGVLAELAKLEPGVDVEDKYVGIACLVRDKDEIVRRMYLRWKDPRGRKDQSIIFKSMNLLSEKIPESTPDLMCIDFASPPNSELYPVRSVSFLLDPEQKLLLFQKAFPPNIKLSNAIVFLSDGETNLYNTPLTNDHTSLMSENEIFAHALETISRQSWPRRLQGLGIIFYIALSTTLGGLLWVFWKSFQQNSRVSIRTIPLSRIVRPLADLSALALLLCGNYFIACFVFAKFGLIVPIFTTCLGLASGTLAAILWEREREREDAFLLGLKSAKEKLELVEEKYQAELKQQQAEAQAEQILQDQNTRREFIKRVNHDLSAPVSLLNWTISELQSAHLNYKQIQEKINRLIKASDKLSDLIDQLVQSYDCETMSTNSVDAPTADLTKIISDSIEGQLPLANAHEDNITWKKPDEKLIVEAHPVELMRIMDNVVRNAIKHNPSHTTVTVDTEKSERYCTVTISDNGKGIAPQYLEQIFEPGFQVEPDRGNGQGLGLDIARTLLRSIGGDIEVSSAIQQGTTFKLKIPTHEELESRM